MRLKYRLLLLVLVALLPAIAVFAYNETMLHEQRGAELRTQTLRQAQLAASEIERILDGVENLLTAVSVMSDRGDCVAYTAALVAQIPQLADILTLDTSGRVICHKDRSQLGRVWTAGSDTAAQAMASGKTATGVFAMGDDPARPELPIARPMYSAERRIVGVALAFVDLKWLSERLAGRGINPGDSVTVADRNGVILARAPEPERFMGTQIPAGLIFLVKAHEPGALEVLSQDGARRILGYVPAAVSPHGIYVSAGAAADAVFRDVTNASIRSALFLGLGLAAAAYLFWIASRRFIERPIARLHNTAQKWRDGVLTARTGMSARDGEIGIIGAEFDRAMATIAEREEVLRDVGDRLRLAVEATGIGIWDVDVAGGKRIWSPEFRAIIGVPPDTSADQHRFSALIHPDDRERVSAAYTAAYAAPGNERYEAEFRIHRADDGALRWVVTKGLITFGPDGKAIRGNGTLQDVTARHAADESIREEQARLQAMADNLPQGFVYQMSSRPDGKRRFTYASRGVERIFGLTPAMIEAEPQLFFRRVHPSSLPRLEAAEREAAQNKTDFQVEVQVKVANDGYRWFQVSSAPRRLANGETVWDGVGIDIELQKQREARIVDLIREVAHRVKNQFAIILSMGRMTGKQASDVPTYQRMFERRLQALSRSHDLLVSGEWAGAELDKVVQAQLESFAPPDRSRISISGAPILLKPQAVHAIGMAIHELATNATKYGGLSEEGGNVAVTWHVNGSAGGRRLNLRWEETSPRGLDQPARRGFGSEVLNRLAPASVEGEAELRYGENGIVWELSMGEEYWGAV